MSSQAIRESAYGTFDATTNGIEYDVLILRCADTTPIPRGT